MNQAEDLVQAKKYDEAIAIFEQMLRDFPQSAKVWSKYGQTLALPEVDRDEEAYISFEKARQIDPNDKKVLSRYCKFLQDPNRFNRSKELLSIIYEDLLQLEPYNVVTLTGYGKALVKEGEYEKEKGEYEKAQVKYEKAIGILESALKREPGNKITLNVYAEALIKNENYTKAFDILERLLVIEPSNNTTVRTYANALASNGQFEKAWHFFDKSLQNKPDDAVTLSRYANALASNGQFEKAWHFFDKSLQNKPDDAVTLSRYANALASNGQFEKAWHFFDKSLQIEPNAPITLNLYATALASNGQHEKALEFLERSIQIEPNAPITLSRYATALTSNGQHEKALQYFERSLQLEPNAPITLSRYATALTSNGQHEKALQYFERSLQLEPNNPITLSRYATALASSGQHEKLVQILERSLQLEPNDPITLNLYANALASTGQHEKALQYFELSLQLEPNAPITLSRYATALASTGQYEKALQYFELSLQLEPNAPITLSRYANALASNGHPDQALQFFERSIQIEPNHPRTLSCYAHTLATTGQYEKALQYFELSLQIKPQNARTLSSYLDFQYALVLEKVGKHQEAIDQLKAIKIEALTPYQANVIRVNLGRLYYQIKQPEKGNEYFEAAIANSDDKDRTDDKEITLLYISRSILATKPYSERAVELLRQIKEDSPRYAQALEMLTLNLSEEGYFEMFKTDTQIGLSDTEMLNRAMYHKIANEISILKGIAYRILRRSEREDPLLSGIIQDIEDVFAEVDRRRVVQKSEIETIPHDDYCRILAVISKTAHDISDFVNNQLAVIESKTRRAMRKLQPSDAHYSQFEKLLTQLELTQIALSDLKAINEGITIKNHRFKVKKLFEKWETMPQIDRAQILLDIHNGDSEFNGDEEKIKSALNELVENSLKHNSNQQNLTIRITSQDVINPPEIRGRTMPGEQKYLFIELVDNGEGVPEDKKDWIFQPLRTTSQEGKGSGLGLFIIRKTLTKMNGHIRETGYNGAQFEIYIPYK
ncbi:tetratricopeptide repeat protein [Oscillatoria nigro-viridis]|nr:tetratricopeptide repeat protein [Oscillatoria nigro-viridis]